MHRSGRIVASGRRPLSWRPQPALAAAGIDIAAVQGADYDRTTIEAVERLDGMGKFVPKQSRVGLLINSDAATVRAVIALDRTVDRRIGAAAAGRPVLADRLLGEPLAFCQPKYVRGPLGVMGSYVFDTEDVFRVREGLIGAVDDCRAFVFDYPVERERAVTRFDAGSRFKNRVRQADRYTMIDRRGALVAIRQTGRYIAIAIGNDHGSAMSIADRLTEKLNQGGSHGSP